MSDSLSDTVRCAVAQHLDVPSAGVRPTDRFERDLGLRPLDVFSIALRLEEMENVELPIDELDALHKVADLTALLRTALESGNHVANDNGKAWRRARARRPRPMLRMVLGIR
jgi:acyl carrier protein